MNKHRLGEYLSLHPQAATLTMLLISERAGDVEYAAYTVLERYFEDWPDEKLADLYASIAEKYDPKAFLAEQERLLSRLLWDNENWWARR